MYKNEIMQKHYASYSDYLKKYADVMGSRLKYDYKDKKILKSLRNIICSPAFEQYKAEEFIVNMPFIDYLSKLIYDFDSDVVYDYFERALSCVQIIEDETLEFDDCKSSFEFNLDNNTASYKVHIPKYDFSTNYLYTVLAHELGHYNMIFAKRNDFYEYCEVLAMFFEFLMHRAIDEENGYDNFVNFRMNLFNRLKKDSEEDLNYALNPSILKIDRNIYCYPIAASISYLEGFEYVLSLLERRDEDRALVDESINRVILGEMNFIDVSNILDIDSSKYENLKKLMLRKK